jgi:tetratricopeptide (TPR) repeat protein
MAGVFISYAHEDSDTARHLEETLENQNIRVWRDRESIYAGQQWPKAIGEGIAGQQLFLLLWSKNSAASHFVEFEWNTALALKKTIVPLFLDQTPLPPSLRAYNGFFMTDLNQVVKQILTALKKSPPPDPQQNRRVIETVDQNKDKPIEAVLEQIKSKFLIPILLNQEKIEKYIAQIADDMAKMRQMGDQPRPVDFSYYLKEWADKYGFTPDQVKAQFDRWAADVKDSTDYRTLGLREFYLKNFPRASEYFTSAALQGETRRKSLKKQLRQEDLSTYENWKDAGNALYAAYQFREALEKYHKAEEIATFENYPQEWAEIQIFIGNTQWELGIRVGGAESHSLLSAAVTSYRNALRRFTRKDFPQDWAMTHNNLGNALQAQGIRTGGEPGARLLAQAVDAYQKALEVRTLEHLPVDWAQTQNNLAQLYESQENWSAAIECYQQVFKVDPGYAARKLAVLYHDRVFRFDKTLEMNLYVVNRDEPDAVALLRLMENYFTAGHYSEGNQYIDALKSKLTDPSFSKVLIFLQVFEIANFVGLNQVDTAGEGLMKLIELIGEQGPDYKVGWDFRGTKHFVRTHKSMESHREWLLLFFAALEKDNRDGILTGLRELSRTN